MRQFSAIVLMMSGVLCAQDTRGLINQGVSEFKAGNYAGAAADFQRAVDADPSNVTAHLYLGTAWMQQFIPGVETPQNLAAAATARKEYLKILELDPLNGTAMQYLGSLALNQKLWEESQSWYQKVVAMDPGNSTAWYSMGFIAWARVYPVYMAARAGAGLKPTDAGPLPAGDAKDKLKSEYSAVIDGGLHALQQALAINPQYDDAMAYMNLLLRERADVRDNFPDYQRDIDEANSWLNKALATKKAKSEQSGASMTAPPPPPPPAAAGRIRVGGAVMQSMLSHQLPPTYPSEAKQQGISGSVTLLVIVGENGAVKTVSFQSGPQALAQAAIDAVRNWTYKPTLLNNQPVEVETTVTVNFKLN